MSDVEGSSRQPCRRTVGSGEPNRCYSRCRSQDPYTFPAPCTRCTARRSAELISLWSSPLSHIACFPWSPPSVVSKLFCLATLCTYHYKFRCLSSILPSFGVRAPWLTCSKRMGAAAPCPLGFPSPLLRSCFHSVQNLSSGHDFLATYLSIRDRTRADGRAGTAYVGSEARNTRPP